MSTHEHDSDHDLVARLRALPSERGLPADGWARLSAQLPPREPQAAPAPTGNVVVLPGRSRRRWWLPVGAALAASLALYALAGACWLPVVWLQIRMRDLAGTAARQGTPLPPQYWRMARWWFWLGVPAFTAMVLVVALMVFKHLPGGSV